MTIWRVGVAAILLTASAPVLVRAQAGDATPLFRVFLTDGSSLTSYGEWVRMDDQVVFSLPLTTAATPDLQLVSLASGRVDWPRTERYAATARAAHYASTRAEDDFARFSQQVAAVLTGIAREPDAARRLALAESARAALASWPQQHHGYRADDVQQMLTLLDEVVGELRVAAGKDTFELGLVATTPPVPAERLMPAPSTAQLAEELLAASEFAETPAARSTLLERVLHVLDRAASLLPDAWAARVRTTALSSLATERSLDSAYARLAERTLASAAKHTRAADVRALARLKTDVQKADAALGSKRPAEVSAILAAVDAGAESARRLRLARDQWRLRAPEFRSYQRAVNPALRELSRATSTLRDIRAQAGPEPKDLKKTIARFYKARPAVAGTRPPQALQSPHALLQSAWDLASNAFALRMRAVESGDVARAAEASAAAAGALMLAERARDDIDQAVKPPSLP